VDVPGGVENLIKKIRSDLNLKTDCPGSKYSQLFSEGKVDGYLPSPEDDDSDGSD